MSTSTMLRRCAAVSVAGVSLLALSSALLPGAASAAVRPRHATARPAGLHVSGPAVSLGSNPLQDQFTEAPNGDVYYASKSSVYVIKGTSAPALVLTASGTVTALAANSTGLFIDVRKTVTEYNSSLAAVRTWTLAGPHRVTSAGLFAVGSQLWAWTDWSTDASGLEFGTAYRFSASSAAVHRVGGQEVYPGFAVAGSTGFYFETPNEKVASGGYLVRVTPAGAVHRVSNTLLLNMPALAGGRVETLADVTRGGSLKTYLNGYSATALTLAFSRSVAHGNLQLAGTGLGLLMLKITCLSLRKACEEVSTVSTKTGAVGSAVKIPGAMELLPGPSAAVIAEINRKPYLERLAG
jgi:hypothetical protein